MESKFHRWWLGCCIAALLLASWMGGFSVAVTSVFVVIYLTGVTLIGPDDAPAEPVDVVEPIDVVAAEPVDVVPAAPVDVVPAAPEPLVSADVADEGETPADKTSAEDETAAEEPKSETPNDKKSAEDDTALAVTADAEADAEGPADTEAVIVYESAAAAEQETVIVEGATDTDSKTKAEVTLVGDEDDALPYPDDFDDEAAAAVGERSPA